MTLIGRPIWNDIRELRDTDELLQERDNKTKFTPADLVFAEVEFKFNEDVRFPCLPVRTETGLIFPREGFASTHISEIQLTQRLSCPMFLKHGLKIGVVFKPLSQFSPFLSAIHNHLEFVKPE